MKQLIWAWILKAFKKEIAAHVESFKENHYREISKIKDNQKVEINYPIGQKVIIRSNEPDALVVGEVVDYNLHENSEKLFLVIKDLATGELICPLDRNPPYWTKEREQALKKLNWAEQWNVLSKYYDIDLEHQSYKESPEYQNRLKN